jgi:hypothetical protein
MEILELHLSRAGRSEFDGPTLDIRFHLFEGRQDESRASGVRWFNHTQATLRFENVSDLELTGFNHQNAILDLGFTDEGAHPSAPGLRAIRVSIQQAFGLGGSLLCSSVEVTSVEPGCPPGSVYEEEGE